MRFRVTRTWFDDGAFGYTAPPFIEIIKDWLTRAEAKAIYKYYESKHWYNEDCVVSVEVLGDDGAWQNCSEHWMYIGLNAQEEWFEDKGFDYNWWLQFGEIRKV